MTTTTLDERGGGAEIRPFLRAAVAVLVSSDSSMVSATDWVRVLPDSALSLRDCHRGVIVISSCIMVLRLLSYHLPSRTPPHCLIVV